MRSVGNVERAMNHSTKDSPAKLDFSEFHNGAEMTPREEEG